MSSYWLRNNTHPRKTFPRRMSKQIKNYTLFIVAAFISLGVGFAAAGMGYQGDVLRYQLESETLQEGTIISQDRIRLDTGEIALIPTPESAVEEIQKHQTSPREQSDSSRVTFFKSQEGHYVLGVPEQLTNIAVHMAIWVPLTSAVVALLVGAALMIITDAFF